VYEVEKDEAQVGRRFDMVLLSPSFLLVDFSQHLFTTKKLIYANLFDHRCILACVFSTSWAARVAASFSEFIANAFAQLGAACQ